MSDEEKYLVSIMRPLLTVPDDLQIERKTDDRGVLLTVNVAQEDMGRVIGKAGETARSIRRLLHQFGMICNLNVSMKLVDPAPVNDTF